jgi:hypothetical protein
MFTPSPRGGFSPERLFRRIDRAAAQLNPILMLLMVGLLILNLIVGAALVPHLQITRVQCVLDSAGAPRAAEAGPIVMPNGGLN